MSLVIAIPDETARRIEAVAAARGESSEMVVLEALASSPLLAGANPPTGDELLEDFIGCGSSTAGRPSEIHEMRRELAARRATEGIENL
jgi:hypothetical protein